MHALLIVTLITLIMFNIDAYMFMSSVVHVDYSAGSHVGVKDIADGELGFLQFLWSGTCTLTLPNNTAVPCLSGGTSWSKDLSVGADMVLLIMESGQHAVHNLHLINGKFQPWPLDVHINYYV